MSKRKGLSLEEKRDKVLEVFTTSADVFVLKVSSLPQPMSVNLASAMHVKGAGLPKHTFQQIATPALASLRYKPGLCKQQLTSAVLHMQDVEKLASKKGVVLQTIKEVLQVGDSAAVQRAHHARRAPHAARWY
jgi:hypothetical protein